jgi:predicted MFS family arabinose efflux permease
MAAVSLTAVTFHLARFAGPALAGICMSFYGIEETFLMVALSYAVMLVAVFTLRIPSRPWLDGLQKRSLFAELRDGVSYVLTHRAIAYILLIQTILALFARPLGELLPAFVGSVFSAGPGMLAVLTSAMGIGAVAGGLRLLLWDVDRGLPSLIIWSTATSGIGVILFSLTPNIWIGTVIIFFVAYWVTVCGIASQTLIQTCVDENKRGRVLSLWAAIYRGAPGMGALLIGWSAGSFGLVWPNVVAASICVMGAGWMMCKKAVLDAAAS